MPRNALKEQHNKKKEEKWHRTRRKILLFADVDDDGRMNAWVEICNMHQKFSHAFLKNYCFYSPAGDRLQHHGNEEQCVHVIDATAWLAIQNVQQKCRLFIYWISWHRCSVALTQLRPFLSLSLCRFMPDRHLSNGSMHIFCLFLWLSWTASG